MKRVFQFPNGYQPDRMRAAVEACKAFGGAFEVEVREPRRNDAQNKALHAALTDIAKQVDWYGRKMPVGVWKRMATFAWLRAEGEQCFAAPSLDGMGIDTVWEKTSQLSVAQMTSLLEWVYAFGAEHDCKFRTKEKP